MKYRNRYASLYLTHGYETRGWTFKIDGDGQAFCANGHTGGMAVRTAARAALSAVRSKAAMSGKKGMQKVRENVGVFLAIDHPVFFNRAGAVCKTTLPAIIPMTAEMSNEPWLDFSMSNLVDLLLQVEENELRRIVLYGVSKPGSFVEIAKTNLPEIFKGESTVTLDVFVSKMEEVSRQFIYAAARNFLLAGLALYSMGESWLSSDFYFADANAYGGGFPEESNFSAGVKHLYASLKRGGMGVGWQIAMGFDRIKDAFFTHSQIMQQYIRDNEKESVSKALQEGNVEGFRRLLENDGFRIVFYDVRQGRIFSSDAEMYAAMQRGEDVALSCRYTQDENWKTVKDIMFNEAFDQDRFNVVVKNLKPAISESVGDF